VFVSDGSLIFSAAGRDELPVFSRPVQVFPPEAVANIREGATWVVSQLPGEKLWTLRIYEGRSMILELDLALYLGPRGIRLTERRRDRPRVRKSRRPN
jgi:hypothetical protein